MCNLYNTLKILCDKRGITQSRMCRDVGLSASMMTDLKMGRKKSVSAETANKIANYFGVTVSFLLGTQKSTPNIVEVQDSSVISFPILGKIAAGYNGIAVEEHSGDTAQFFADDIHGNAADYFCLRVSGNSMYPRLLDGDIVLVHRQPSVDNGTVAVIMYDGEDATVKTVNYVYGEDWLELVPANPEYETKRISDADLNKCRVLGKVVLSQRKW